ncbi:hypothetical protein F4818DRAFT_456405 [Hypoxylon cercidicola]|nr:hypothetical protein F4818DRAFT_456405 [Hypoxylon cercidicola]
MSSSMETMMEHWQPNLDHVVVRVRLGFGSADFTLNTYLNSSGSAAFVRVSSHYDYVRMRYNLRDSIGLDPAERLVFDKTQTVDSKHDLECLLIGIQSGVTILPSLGDPPLTGLILRSESSGPD